MLGSGPHPSGSPTPGNPPPGHMSPTPWDICPHFNENLTHLSMLVDSPWWGTYVPCFDPGSPLAHGVGRSAGSGHSVSLLPPIRMISLLLWCWFVFVFGDGGYDEPRGAGVRRVWLHPATGRGGSGYIPGMGSTRVDSLFGGCGEGTGCLDDGRRGAGGGDLPRLGGRSLPRRGRLLLGLRVRP